MGCCLVWPVMSSYAAVAHKPSYKGFPLLIILAEPLMMRLGNIIQKIHWLNNWSILLEMPLPLTPERAGGGNSRESRRLTLVLSGSRRRWVGRRRTGGTDALVKHKKLQKNSLPSPQDLDILFCLQTRENCFSTWIFKCFFFLLRFKSLNVQLIQQTLMEPPRRVRHSHEFRQRAKSQLSRDSRFGGFTTKQSFCA